MAVAWAGQRRFADLASVLPVMTTAEQVVTMSAFLEMPDRGSMWHSRRFLRRADAGYRLGGTDVNPHR